MITGNSCVLSSGVLSVPSSVLSSALSSVPSCVLSSGVQSGLSVKVIQLWFLELHDSPLELKGELQYLGENCHFRGEKMTILV